VFVRDQNTLGIGDALLLTENTIVVSLPHVNIHGTAFWRWLDAVLLGFSVLTRVVQDLVVEHLELVYLAINNIDHANPISIYQNHKRVII
jgi:hypothetical protein